MNKLILIVLASMFWGQTFSESKWESLLKDITTKVKSVMGSDKKKQKKVEQKSEEPNRKSHVKVLIPSSEIEAKYYSEQIANYNQVDASKREHWNQIYLEELYKVVLKRKINQQELNKFMTQLDQKSSREGLYHYLVLSKEYAELEDRKPLTPNSMILIQHFLKQFLSYEIELSKEVPFFQLKREIVDMCLTRFYRIWDKPQDLYHWYSEISRYLASRPKIKWKYSLRKNKDYKVHFAWSQKVPPELIKSELILKVHSYLDQVRLL
jgi:hypothetical protein